MKSRTVDKTLCKQAKKFLIGNEVPGMNLYSALVLCRFQKTTHLNMLSSVSATGCLH